MIPFDVKLGERPKWPVWLETTDINDPPIDINDYDIRIYLKASKNLAVPLITSPVIAEAITAPMEAPYQGVWLTLSDADWAALKVGQYGFDIAFVPKDGSSPIITDPIFFTYVTSFSGLEQSGAAQ